MKKLSDNLILIVDDSPTNIDILFETLNNLYDVTTAKDGKSALESIAKNPPDLILLDVEMPGINGYEVCKRIRSDKTTEHIPVIFVTSLSSTQEEINGLKLGAVDFISKPFNVEIVKIRVKNQLELKAYRDSLEILVKERTRELELTQEVTIECMASIAEFRDPETGMHIKRTQIYVKELALYLKNHPKFKDYLDDKTVEMIYLSAPLHDIGKVGIPDNILLKPAKLNDEELVIMKKHPIYGRNAIAESEKKLTKSSFLRVAKELAASHHEKWDGTGYPFGLKADNIPIPGRLMAVADVYDALVTKRVYKPAFPHEKAAQIIKEGRSTHFDQDVVDAFLALEKKFNEISIQFADKADPIIDHGIKT